MSNIVRDKKFTELIWMGRTKDLLRAWQLVYLFEKSIPAQVINPIDYHVYIKPHLELCDAYRTRLSELVAKDWFVLIYYKLSIVMKLSSSS